MVWTKHPTEHKKLYKHLSLFWYLLQVGSYSPCFTWVLHYISINFRSISPFFFFLFTFSPPWEIRSKLNTQAPEQQKTILLATPKLALLQENLNCLSLATHALVIFLPFKDREVAKCLLWQADDSWSLSCKVWDQHQVLSCHGSECLLNMESKSHIQTAPRASKFKGTMSLWVYLKLTLKILFTPRGEKETSKEQLPSLWNRCLAWEPLKSGSGISLLARKGAWSTVRHTTFRDGRVIVHFIKPPYTLFFMHSSQM